MPELIAAPVTGGNPLAVKSAPAALLLILAAALVGAWLPVGALASVDEPGDHLIGPGPGPLSDSFVVRGQIQLARTETEAGDHAALGAQASHYIRADARSRAVFMTRDGVLPEEVERYDTLSMWVYRPSDSPRWSRGVTLDITFYEEDMRTHFTRRATFDHSGWRRFEFPLAFFRWGDGRVPAWEDVRTLAFSFRSSGSLKFHDIRLENNETGRGAELLLDDILPIAFAGPEAANLRVVRDSRVHLATNSPDLAVDQLVARLYDVYDSVLEDFPFLSEPPSPPLMLVFASEEEYRSFVPRFASAFGAYAPEPNSDGYALMGVCLVAWNPVWGNDRPTFTHEYIHALLARVLWVQNRSEWLHEGFANHYQLRYHPEEHFPRAVLSGIRGQLSRRPLREIFSGETVETMHYWQVVTGWQMLVFSPQYRDQFPDLLQRLGRLGHTDLGPHLIALYGRNWSQFEADWEDFCETYYGLLADWPPLNAGSDSVPPPESRRGF